MSGKDTINVKSNGLRNELKEIRKSIDKLTNAIEAQTNRRYEKGKTIYHPMDSGDAPDGMCWVTNHTTTSGSIEQREVSKSD